MKFFQCRSEVWWLVGEVKHINIYLMRIYDTYRCKKVLTPTLCKHVFKINKATHRMLLLYKVILNLTSYRVFVIWLKHLLVTKTTSYSTYGFILYLMYNFHDFPALYNPKIVTESLFQIPLIISILHRNGRVLLLF